MLDKELKIDKKAVGRRIKNIRLSKGLTLDGVGKILKADTSNICRWENGKMLPSKNRIYKISKFAGITVNQLLYGGSEQDIEELYERLIRLSNDEILNIMERVTEYVKERRNDDRHYK